MKSPLVFSQTEDAFIKSCAKLQFLRDDSVNTTFQGACTLNNPEFVSILLDKAQEKDIDVKTGKPLHIASMSGHFKVVNILLQRKNEIGIDVHALDKFGKTALQWAKEKNFQPVIEVFKQHGFT